MRARRDSGGGTAVGAAYWKYQGRLDVAPAGSDAGALYDLSARFYSPSLGTFTQLDSVMGSAQDPRSMNRFPYAHANPATLIDPTGHSVCSNMADWCDQPDGSRIIREEPVPVAPYPSGTASGATGDNGGWNGQAPPAGGCSSGACTSPPEWLQVPAVADAVSTGVAIVRWAQDAAPTLYDALSSFVRAIPKPSENELRSAVTICQLIGPWGVSVESCLNDKLGAHFARVAWQKHGPPATAWDVLCALEECALNQIVFRVAGDKLGLVNCSVALRSPAP